MRPFQPNPQQLEALANGAVKLWMPLKGVRSTDKLQHMTTVLATFIDEEGNLVVKDVPLQPGESYFVQEEFIEDPSQIIYKANFSKSNQDLEDWQPADQMIEAQSQYKLTVTDVEVKSVQDNYGNDKAELAGQSDNWLGYVDDKFEQRHDSQYSNQPYSSNPTGFLVTIERIEDAKEN